MKFSDLQIGDWFKLPNENIVFIKTATTDTDNAYAIINIIKKYFCYSISQNEEIIFLTKLNYFINQPPQMITYEELNFGEWFMHRAAGTDHVFIMIKVLTPSNLALGLVIESENENFRGRFRTFPRGKEVLKMPDWELDIKEREKIL